jgi:hypothetical protein
MRAVFGNEVAVATEIGGHFRPGTDRIVRTLVGPVCRVIWPDKTDANIAVICGCDPRNARRYMSGELPIPAVLLAAISVELVKRFE